MHDSSCMRGVDKGDDLFHGFLPIFNAPLLNSVDLNRLLDRTYIYPAGIRMAGPPNAPEYLDSHIDICGIAENLKLYFANDLISQFDGVLAFARTECAQKAFNVKKRESLEACSSQRMDQVCNPIALVVSLTTYPQKQASPDDGQPLDLPLREDLPGRFFTMETP